MHSRLVPLGGGGTSLYLPDARAVLVGRAVLGANSPAKGRMSRCQCELEFSYGAGRVRVVARGTNPSLVLAAEDVETARVAAKAGAGASGAAATAAETGGSMGTAIWKILKSRGVPKTALVARDEVIPRSPFPVGWL